MFLNNLSKRRVASLIRPWIIGEPELEVKLGFTHSLVIVKNIRLNVSLIKELFNEPVLSFSFDEVIVEQFILRFSNWSFPAFSLEVNGVNVIVSVWELTEEDSINRSCKRRDSFPEDLKKKLSEIDPEGSALHDVLEKLLVIAPSKSKFKKAFLNLMLKHFQLCIHDISVRVKFPFLNEPEACLINMKELISNSLCSDNRCIFRGLLDVIFIPTEKCSYAVNGSGFEIRLKRAQQSTLIFFSPDLYSCIKLNNLQPVYLILRFPELCASVSPADLSMYAAFSKIWCKESQSTRNARQLWNLAASRIKLLTSAPRFSLHKAVVTVGLWLQYVKAYEFLLLLIGHCADYSLKRSITKMPQDNISINFVKDRWKLISDIERELPAETIAQARRIAHYRAALNVESTKINGSFAHTGTKFFHKIVALLALSWNVIHKLIYLLLSVLSFRKLLYKTPNNEYLENSSNDCYPHFSLILNLERILVDISHGNEIQPSRAEKLESHIGISNLDYVSLSLSLDSVLLKYMEDISEQSMMMSCGQLNVKCSSFNEAPLKHKSSKKILSSMTAYMKGANNNLKSILWSEPAKPFFPSGMDHVDGSCNPILEGFLQHMWLNWKRNCMEDGESEILFSESPFFLCEITRSFMYPSTQKSDSGLSKCFLTMGKVNLALEHSSILSISLLLWQIKHIWRIGNNDRSIVLSHPPRVTEDIVETSWANTCKSYLNNFKMSFFKMVPEKYVQVGILIAGPHIKFSFKMESCGYKESTTQLDGCGNCFLALDVHDIKVAVWPTLTFDPPLHSGLPGFDSVFNGSKQHRMINTLKPDNEKYISQMRILLGSYIGIDGLNVYLEDSAEQKNQIFALEPVTFQLSSFREYFHTFSSTIMTSSATFSGIATGLIVMAYVNEFYVLFQVFFDLFSAVSTVLSSFTVTDSAPSEIISEELPIVGYENGDTFLEGSSLISLSMLFLIEGIFRVESLDLVLHKSRSSDDLQSSMKTFNVSGGKRLAEADLPDSGIWISIPQASVYVSCEEEELEISTHFSEMLSAIFKYQNQKGKSRDHTILRDLLLQSFNCLYEIFVSSCGGTFFLSLHDGSSSGGLSNKLGLFRGDTSNIDNISFIDKSERSNGQSCSSFQKLEFTSNIPEWASSHWLTVNAVLSTIFVGRCCSKNALLEAHELNNLLSSFSVDVKLQRIWCGLQGGYFFLGATALEIFINCFAAYHSCLSNLLSVKCSFDKNTVQDRSDMKTELDNCVFEEYIQEIHHTLPLVKTEDLGAFTLDVSKFSTVLVFEDENGVVQELVLEIDVRLEYELINMRRKFKFDLSRLSIISQVLEENVGNEFAIPKFSSVLSDNLSTQFVSRDLGSRLHKDAIHLQNDPSCSKDSGFKEEISTNNCVSEVFHLNYQKYILEHLGAFVSVEKPLNSPFSLSQAWLGNGSIVGFHIKISFSEMKMILFTISSFSEAFRKIGISESKNRHLSSIQETESRAEAMVPNGSIVAVQDVHQHMYFAVDGEQNKYSIVGAVHYSLVGERALFKVEYHEERRWRSSIMWFSLISLHAKNHLGEPLRLNYSPGSGFVDISSTNENAWALWRTLPCEPERFEGDIDWETYHQLFKGTFYLVNKKNDCAVVFIDGVPEFVRKPGNPFKFKVFNDLSVACDFIKMHSLPFEDHGTSTQDNDDLMDKGRVFGQCEKLPCLNITVDKVSLTIVHEHSDNRDMFPLLQGCINNTKLNVQLFSFKIRVISTSNIVVYYFDSRRNSWSELLYPVEICLFYRSNFYIKGSEAVLHGVPVHIHCRTKQWNISLTELSLDMLLFVIGKLELAGPYSLKSNILANCCKVENRSGLNLLCHFFNKQSVKIGRNQTSTILLSYLDLTNKPQGVPSVVSFQLASPGSFTTTLIHLSHLQAQALAWRTRIVAPEGSRTYPGPFVVVDILRKSEDGLSISVSPLIRIHNETPFSLELRFQRPQQKEHEFASLVLKSGDSIDDSVAMFDAIQLSGALRKAFTSLSIGNFLLSFRPKLTDGSMNSNLSSVGWSEDLKGGKAVCLSGIFEKLSYKVRKALFVEPVKCSFTTAKCTLTFDRDGVSNMHFLIQSIGRDVPIVQPSRSTELIEHSELPVALQQQKEIFIIPTVRLSNLLHSEIHVVLSDKVCADISSDFGFDNIGNQAVISYGSTEVFFVDPDAICFTVTLAAYSSRCKPVNSNVWLKKLQKQKSDVHCLDVELDFGGGSYFASLRLSRGHRGVLQATIFTSYALKNDTDYCLYLFASNKKALSREEVGKFDSGVPPELGLLLPPKSTGSWFLRSNKVRLRLLKDDEPESLLDLDALSGLTEISLETGGGFGSKSITKLGVSMGPAVDKVVVPSQLITIVPRYVAANESGETIIVRQCFLQDDMDGSVAIKSKQRTALQLKSEVSKRREFSSFEKLMTKHRKSNDDGLTYIQFQLNEPELGWSGPVCVASFGRFFVKFKKHISNHLAAVERVKTELASVHVVEEGSTLVLHFYRPPDVNLPYRIENSLQDVSITFYQKDSSEPEILGSGSSVDYVWDDLTLPHKLVVRVNDSLLLREIKLDKLRRWKPFHKYRQHRGLSSQYFWDKMSGRKLYDVEEFNHKEMVKTGYEVYADGPTRVLRFCEISSSRKRDTLFQSWKKIQLRVPQFTVNLLEHGKQDENVRELLVDTPIIAARLGNFNLDSLLTDQQKYNRINIQYLDFEQKWLGAPHAAMLRRHRLVDNDPNDGLLRVVFVLLSTSSDVIQVKYLSVALQPVDLSLHEETLMRLVPFWRTSLSSNAKSRQFYFEHFEIQPIKIIANFLPGESYSSYSSAQETLRTLLHSVIKVPSIKNMVVELNGVLVTHALITLRELLTKCAQHYSWYAMRAIYIAKGSPLLPPDFVSIFDDLASSSLDVFFDPSRGLMNLPGFTLGTFKFISKRIGGKGFSGTKRYFGDLGISLRTAGSNVLFAAITEISDSVLKGAEASGVNGMVTGFHQGILKLAMEPSLLGIALMEGGPDRKIKLDRSPEVDELYIEGYLQAMLDTLYRQEYLRVRVIDDQVYLKNLPPSSTLIDEIMDNVKSFLVSKALLKGDPSKTSHSLRHLPGESDPRLGPTLLTLCEHLFVSFAIRLLRKQANKFIVRTKWNKDLDGDKDKAVDPAHATDDKPKVKFIWKWGIGKFVLSGIVAYVDGRLCRSIPNPIARRIVSGFLLTFLDKNNDE